MMRNFILTIAFGCMLATVIHGAKLRDLGCREARAKRLLIDPDNVVDLTHEFNESSIVWPTDLSVGVRIFEYVKGLVTNGPFSFFLASNTYSAHDLAGTHVDAPYHFRENGKQAHQLEFKDMIGPGVLIDLVKDGLRFPRDKMISREDILKWERKHGGRIHSGSIVLFRTGYGELYWSDRDGYFGTPVRGKEASKDLHSPGLDPEAAKWLLEKRCISAVGIDHYNIDHGEDLNFSTHQIFANANVAVHEDLANLEKLVETPRGFFVFSMPLPIKGGSGAPTRIIAFLNK